jgi:hypothetical protein
VCEPVWMALSLACLAGGPLLENAEAVRGTAARAESDSFVVVNRSWRHDARQVAGHCEELRAKLACYWCGESSQQAWSPKCELVVHAGRQDYLAVVGPGGAATFGSSLLDFGRQRQISRRRIDIRGDCPAGIAAVPHELTHIVLAELLGRQPPRWADEGMALLADSRQKQLLHQRDLAHGLASGRAFRLAELLALEAYPHASRVPAFYGQSASLAAWLAQRGEPAKLVEFLRASEQHGYDQALREIYSIDGIGGLERLWRAQSAYRLDVHPLSS